MKNYLIIFILFLQISSIYAKSNSNSLKQTNLIFFKEFQNKYFFIKESIFSPYNDYNYKILNNLDSLYILSVSIQSHREKMLSLLVKANISYSDFLFFDQLNKKYIIMLNAISQIGNILLELDSKTYNKSFYSLKNFNEDIKILINFESKLLD